MEGVVSLKIPPSVCLFCVSEELAEVRKDDNKLYKRDNRIISSQLKSIFVLRQLLGLPVEKCCEYLAENDGTLNPDGWFAMCSNCDAMVDQCCNIHQQMLLLKEKMEKLSRILKRRIEVTQDGRKWTAKRRGRNQICYNIRCQLLDSGSPSPCHDSRVTDISGSPNADDTPLWRRRSSNKDSRKEPDLQETSLSHDLGDLLEFTKNMDLGIEPLSPQIVSPMSPDCNSEGSVWQPSDNELSLEEDGTGGVRETQEGLHRKVIGRTITKEKYRAKVKARIKRTNMLKRKRKTYCISRRQLTRRGKICDGEESEEDLSSKKNKKVRILYHYNCQSCPAFFNCKQRLEAHSKLHESNSEGVACSKCGWVCEKGQQLGLHMSFRHARKDSKCNKRRLQRQQEMKHAYKHVTVKSLQKEIPLYCDYCEMIFTRKVIFVRHFELFHDTEDLFVCQMCHEKFHSKQLLELHCELSHLHNIKKEVESINSVQEESRHECQHCFKVFPTLIKKDFHIAKDHKDILLTCKTCGFKAYTLKGLADHQQISHGKEKIVCATCNKQFPNVSSCRSHKRVDHYDEINEDSIKCGDCGAVFPNNEGLDVHMKAVQECRLRIKPEFNNVSEEPVDDKEKEIPYYCDNCHMILTSKKQFLKHFRCNHTNIDLLPCQTCEEQFQSKQLLEMHCEERHSDEFKKKQSDIITSLTQEQSHNECQHCSETFPTQTKRDYHIAKYHKAELLTCKTCGFKAPKYSHLIKHQQTHENNEFICELCTKSFRSVAWLRYHKLRSHHKEMKTEPIKCTRELKSKMKSSSILRRRLTRRSKMCDGNGRQEDEYTINMNLNIEPLSPENVIPSSPDCNSDGSDWQPSDNELSLEEDGAAVAVGKEDCSQADAHGSESTKEDRYKAPIKSIHIFKSKRKASSIIRRRLTRRRRRGICDEEENEDLPNKKARIQYRFNCQSCPAFFYSMQKLQAHKKLHDRNNSVACSKCGWVCGKGRQLGLHMKFRHSLEDSKWNLLRLRKQQGLKHAYKHVTHEPLKKEIPLYCDYCEMIFTRKVIFVRHFDLFHDTEDLFVCQMCHEKFHSTQLLEIHCELTHLQKIKKEGESINVGQEESHHKCKHCSETFPTQIKRDYHIAKDHRDVFLTCKTCGFKEYSFPGLADHQQISHGKDKIVCELCNKQFPNMSSCRVHKRLDHYNEMNEDTIKCEDCGAVFLNNEGLDVHMKAVEECRLRILPDLKNLSEEPDNDKEIPYYCDHCHMILTSKKQFFMHFRCNHKNVDLLPCQTCEEQFQSKQLLEMHCEERHSDKITKEQNYIIANSAPEEALHECQHCMETFPTKIKRDYHIAKYHKAELLTCKTCGLKSPKYSHLLRHQKTHGDNRLICEHCSKQFRCISGLRFHKQRIHYKEINTEPIKCTECGVVFHSSETLNRHIRAVHEKIKDHFCEYCGKAFARISDLNKHILLHTAPKELQYKQGPFTCQFCQAQFNVRQGLYYHLKRLHSDKYSYRCDKCGNGYASENTLLQHTKSCKKKSSSNDAPSQAIPSSSSS